MDYALPAASALPDFAVGHLETPSPLTPGGYKGMGEGGTIGAPAAIANAVADAVRPSASRSRRCRFFPKRFSGREPPGRPEVTSEYVDRIMFCSGYDDGPPCLMRY